MAQVNCQQVTGAIRYNGITPSLAVQFDTYRDNPIEYPDNNDPGEDFFLITIMLIDENGSCNHETVDDIYCAIFSYIYRRRRL